MIAASCRKLYRHKCLQNCCFAVTFMFVGGVLFSLMTVNKYPRMESWGNVQELDAPRSHRNYTNAPFVDIPLPVPVRTLAPLREHFKEITPATLCYGRGIRPRGTEKMYYKNDILKIPKMKFLPDYENPCFYGNATITKEITKDIIKDGKKKKEVVDTLVTTDWRLRCLPYFFIIGMPKGGTTDLWIKLINHPDVAAKHFKEPMFFNRKRFGKFVFMDYLNHFDEAAQTIEATVSPSTHHKHVPYHHVITGEATVDISFDNNHWRQLPGNEDCNEPRITNPHFLHHLVPKMKLIVMMRNPVDRVFSDYLYESQFFGYNKTVDDFHLAILMSMANHFDCRKYFTDRGCAYNNTLETFKARLRVGMYHVFLEDWLRVFPRKQVMFVKFEDHKANAVKTFRDAYTFLGLRQLTEEEEKKLFYRAIPNTRSKKDEMVGDMLPETRDLLTKFYNKYNHRLAQLLHDKRYLWST